MSLNQTTIQVSVFDDRPDGDGESTEKVHIGYDETGVEFYMPNGVVIDISIEDWLKIARLLRPPFKVDPHLLESLK